MQDIELTNKATTYIAQLNSIYRNRPKIFTPKEIADAVGGAYTALGRVADDVVSELRARGINIRYLRIGNRRFFELL